MSEVADTLILIDIIHGHAILRKKEDISDIYLQQSDHRFSRDIYLQSKMFHFTSGKSPDEKKVAAAMNNNNNEQHILFCKIYIFHFTKH